MSESLKPVLIAGAGPAGMMAAIELSRFGIPVRLIEKKSEPETTSRAIGVQARTLELLEQRGLAKALVELGNPGFAGSI
jgi:2-polyprenyl-6-methoxyphenol hydroxylase-like FAD-dependent oxidoreductase